MVEGIHGNKIRGMQDLRDTEGFWFYWYLRLAGARGKKITISFPDKRSFGVNGPAFSLDNGSTWKWAGKETVKGTRFTFKVPADCDEIRFSFGMPYVESNLVQFTSNFKNNKHFLLGSLCHTAKGRDVEKIVAGCLHDKPDYRVVITARHHACEMMASYIIEGMISTILANDDVGRWFQEHVQFLIVPFVDKDGVEDGDQGKNRRPRDHNRDYEGASVHAATRAIRDLIPSWSGGRLAVMLDIHCPYVHDDKIQFIGVPDEKQWKETRELSRILEESQEGPLKHRATDDLPYGSGWNTSKNSVNGKSFSRWGSELPHVFLSTSIEFPYASVHGVEISQGNARIFGNDLARAIMIYLSSKQNLIP